VVLLVALLVGAPVGGAAAAAADHAPGPPAALTVDDDAAPLAVAGTPAFSWDVIDKDRNEIQTAYELFVATAPTRDPSSSRIIWKSGKVRSAQQSYVTASHLRLEPDSSYWWTVRTWDRADRRGPFARPARFDTGLGDGDWHAAWIRRAQTTSAVQDFTLVRREIRLGSSPIVRARAYVSAGQQYDLRINGVRAAHGPSYSYPDEQYYEATDVTRLLRPGQTNVIAAVTNWATPSQGRPPSRPGFIARLTVTHANGSRDVLVTDGSWRVHAGPWIQDGLRNDEGEWVESIDARLEPSGWDRAGFDDSSWEHAQVLGMHPVAPFAHLIPEATHLVEHEIRPVTLRRLTSGAYVADFGAVTSATPVVRFHDGTAGRAVRIVGGDLLDPNGQVSTTHGNQGTDMHWDYIERAGAQEFRPFGYLGFRYLEVDGSGETLARGDVVMAARHASVPDEHAATFHSSDRRIEAVWQLAQHSALYDIQEHFLDTPTRERGQFLADAFDVSSATMRAFDERELTKQALREFARSQARYWPDGRVNAVYPNGDGKRDIPDFTEMYVEWVWRTYMDTGDRALLESLYPTVTRVGSYIAGAIDPHTQLVTDLPGGDGDYLYGIVDWPMAMRYGYDMATVARTTENVLAVDVFSRLAAMGRVLARPSAEIDAWDARARALTSAVRDRLRRPDGVFVDGLEVNGAPSAHASQHANAYALLYGLVPPDQQSAVGRHVSQLGNAMGPMTADVLLRALHRADLDSAVVRAVTDPSRPGWAQILARGATFTWESWNARDVPGDSESHGWGSSVLAVLQEDMLGVTVAAPGASRVDVRIPSVGVMRARGRVPTQRGPVLVSWNRTADDYRIELTVPANVVATVHLPAVASRHGSVRTVGSGSYSFVVARSSSSGSPWAIVLIVGTAAVFAAVVVFGLRRLRQAR
jgi:alpha-L-rhamnosidase